MSNLRKRNTKTSNVKDASGSNAPSLLKKVRFAFEEVVLRRTTDKSNKSHIRRIEEMSVWPYIVLFVLFLTFGIYFIDYLHKIDDIDFDPVLHTEYHKRRFIPISCSNDYGSGFKDCRPKKCGRAVRDGLFTSEELEHLRKLVEKGMLHGGGNGGATILDLHTGALSYGDQFINFYKAKPGVFNNEDFKLYKRVKDKIHATIAEEFNINKKHLHLTKPTFFSRLTSKPAVTQHDEYWHPHIDRITYKTFFYTSLLYLSEYEVDFDGGRFMFIEKHTNVSVEPKFGRLSFFTSGSENQHFVERVASGVRYAITVSFTCDKKHRIEDPSID